MALTLTKLTAPITASQLLWPVASTLVGFPAIGAVLSGTGQPIQVDDELAFIVQVPALNTVLVRSRGSEGTRADAHDINANVITSSNPTDFPINVPGAAILRPLTAPDVDSYGQNGPISIPVQDTKIQLTGTVAMTLTLGAPSLAANAVELVITSLTPFAHVISGPGLFQTGTTGTPFGTATFPALVGASMWLIAENGFWSVANTQGAVVFT